MQIQVNSYFSGAGLMDQGLLNAGIEINQAFELDKHACKTYRKNIGDHVKHCDLTEELVIGQADCHGMVFTYPCTKYSAIADIHDTRTGDELFLHSLRHIAIADPDFYVVENVKGMRAFPVVMETMTKLANYYINVFCPVKSSLWLPQERDRLIIIGTKKPFTVRPPENTKRVSLAEIIEADPDVPQEHCTAIYQRMDPSSKYRDLPITPPQDKAPELIAGTNAALAKLTIRGDE